jgi:hypothetical protein
VAVVPKANAPKKGRQGIEGLTIHPVERIEEAMEIVRGLGRTTTRGLRPWWRAIGQSGP